jgi:hypothetical protein
MWQPMLPEAELAVNVYGPISQSARRPASSAQRSALRSATPRRSGSVRARSVATGPRLRRAPLPARERSWTLRGWLDVRDVRMVQRCQGLGFAGEPGEPFGVAREERGSTLIATSRLSFVSRARYTSSQALGGRFRLDVAMGGNRTLEWNWTSNLGLATRRPYAGCRNRAGPLGSCAVSHTSVV